MLFSFSLKPILKPLPAITYHYHQTEKSPHEQSSRKAQNIDRRRFIFSKCLRFSKKLRIEFSNPLSLSETSSTQNTKKSIFTVTQKIFQKLFILPHTQKKPSNKDFKEKILDAVSLDAFAGTVFRDVCRNTYLQNFLNTMQDVTRHFKRSGMRRVRVSGIDDAQELGDCDILGTQKRDVAESLEVDERR